MSVQQPHFAGPLFQGMNIRAEEWTLQPDVGLTFRTDGGVVAGASETMPLMDLSGVRADFGFARLEGLANDDAQRPGLRFDIDVDTLASFGGPLPELLRKTGLRTSGELRAPLREDLGELPLGQLLGLVGVDIRLDMNELEVGGQLFRNLGAQISLQDGKAELTTTGGTFDGGALRLTLASDDITKLAAADVRVEAGVDAANVGAQAVEGLQYVFPVLAGLQQVPVDQRVFSSKLDFAVRLAGPVAPGEGQELLSWLDQWSGNGGVRLFDGKLAPAGGLQELLQLTGDAARTAAGPGGGRKALLDFKDLATEFVLREGAVENSAMKLAAAGREIGLQGKTRLGGGIDYLIDARSLLAQHKDGRKVLELLGEDFEIGARLTGSLGDPQLALPDVAGLIQDKLPDLLREQGQDLLEREGGKLLDDLLKRGKDGEQKGEKDSTDRAVEAARGLLEGVLGGQRKKDEKQQQDGGEDDPDAPGKSRDKPEDQARKALQNVLKGVLGGGR
jgi:hypothetical protein